jgi:YNFM family putative membrane transporter
VIFDMFGWTACVAGIGLSLVAAAILALSLKTPLSPEAA